MLDGAPRVPALTLLCHPEASRVGERAALTHLASGREVRLSRLEPGFAQPGAQAARPKPLADIHLSRRPLRLVPTELPGEVRLVAPAGLEVTLNGQAIVAPCTVSSDELERGGVLMLAQRVVLLLHLADPAPPVGVPRYSLVGESAPLIALRQRIQRVADLAVPVLLRGPTGSGKELAAQALHQAGPRAQGPFVAVNMASVPPSLAAAELFGAAKGAYTGSNRQRLGHFTRADGGSLFLDEIGEVPTDVQALLLRALKTSEVQAVGAERPRRLDVRLIAATDANLEDEAANGRFRAPLLHRLSGYVIDLPSLAERRDDIGRLLYAFVHEELEILGESHSLETLDPGVEPWLPAPLVDLLARFDWPGNVRQLRNVARELAIEGRGTGHARLGEQTAQLIRGLPRQVQNPAATLPDGGRRYRKPADISEDELVATLRAHRWLLRPAAAEIGISRTSLYALVEASSRLSTAAQLTDDQLHSAVKRHGRDLQAMADDLEVSEPGLRRRLAGLKPRKD